MRSELDSVDTQDKSAAQYEKTEVAVAVFGSVVGSVSVLILVFGFVLWWRQRHNQPTFFDVKGVY